MRKLFTLLENTASDLRAQLDIYRGFPKSRLNEIVDADMAGRLVVLPCAAAQLPGEVTHFTDKTVCGLTEED